MLLLASVLANLSGAAEHPGARLLSEAWTSLVPGSTGKSLTTYEYDSHGFRVGSKSWVPDTAGTLTSSSGFALDAEGRILSCATLSAGDTTSSYENSWGPDGRLRSTTTFGPHHAVRFVDSFSTISQTRRESWRTSAAGALLWKETRDSSTSSVLDTLFEPGDNGTIAASKTTVSTLDERGFVVGEVESIFQSGSWYALRTVEMQYAASSLVSVRGLDGDGTSRSLLDSSFYEYDASGSRIAKTLFDANRTATDRWTWQWWYPSPTSLRVALPSEQALIVRGRSIALPTGSQTVELFDLRGGAVWSWASGNTARTSLPSSLRPGRYAAAIRTSAGTRLYSLAILD